MKLIEKDIKVKICGITNFEDALAAAMFGADAIGFVFYEGSPRYIALEEAAEISRELPPFLARVGVFVNSAEEKVVETAQLVGLDYFQFHGEESPRYCGFFGRRAIKAFRIATEGDVNRAANYRSVKTVLFDTKVDDVYGGTGVSFDWDLLTKRDPLKEKYIILSGGLSEENVLDAIEIVLPDAVDISSALEKEPGLKDHGKMEKFIKTVKSVNREAGRQKT